MTPPPSSPAAFSPAFDRTLTWYVRAIRDLGFPMLVAGVLLWMLVKDVPGNAAAASRDAALARKELADHINESRRDAATISRLTAEQSIRLARIMQQICVNTASTANERDRCFPE